MTTEYHPLIYTYLKKYQDDPNSRIFAPLAEAYRKAGLIDEAIDIAKTGLKTHPGFVGGKVALARALFEKRDYTEVILLLTPVIQEAPDNLAAQRLMAESCLMLGRVAEALAAYKMVLYFAPQDEEVAQLVRELEVQAYENGALVLRKDPVPPAPEFQEAKASEAIDNDPKLKRIRWVKQIETLQALLQKVERYRAVSG